jgi:hypothetical protein
MAVTRNEFIEAAKGLCNQHAQVKALEGRLDELGRAIKAGKLSVIADVFDALRKDVKVIIEANDYISG